MMLQKTTDSDGEAEGKPTHWSPGSPAIALPPLMYHSNWNVKSSMSVKYWSAGELLSVVSHYLSVTYHSAMKEGI